MKGAVPAGEASLEISAPVARECAVMEVFYLGGALVFF